MTNSLISSATALFILFKVAAHAAAPVISSQPESVTISAGNAARFSVEAVGGSPFVYQWQWNGVDITGETNSSLEVTSITPTDFGAYSVLVSNDSGSQLSAPAILTVGEKRVIYVKATAAGSNNGTSWSDAFNDLQSGVNAAADGDEIWVAAGTYKPSASGNLDACFSVSKDVKIFGGFEGNEVDVSARDWHNNQTVLSGDLLGDDAGLNQNQNDNSKRVVVIGNGANCVLDGFHITGGRARGFGQGPDSGAGLLVHEGATAAIRDCVFRWNSAVSYGGALGSFGARSLTVDRCHFYQNSAPYNGGGGMISYGDDSASLGWTTACIVKNSLFANNSGSASGGVLLYYTQIAYVGNSVFLDNVSGGGFQSHVASGALRGFSAAPGRFWIVNSTFAGNSNTRGVQGALQASPPDDGNSVLANSIVVGSGADPVSFPFMSHLLSDQTITGGSNLTGAPLFSDTSSPLGPDGKFATRDDGYFLAESSVGRGAGSLVYAPAKDATGVVRLLPDLGAYQSFLPSADSDGDGVNNYREAQDGTDPNDPESFNTLSKGLVAYYPFDGNANDESGYGNSGTLDGAVLTAGRHGVPGTAYFFDGIDDEVAIQPAEPLIGIEGSVTVTAWIYNEGLGAPTFGSQDLQGIFGPATYLAWDSDGGFGLRLYDGNHDSVNSRRYSFTVGAPRQDLDSASIAPEDRWDFVVASYDGNTMRIFRNGLLDASQVVGPGLTRGMSYGGNYFTIGQFVDWSAGTQRCPFHGKIDDVRVYNRALNEAEVGQLYQTDAGNLDSDGDGLTDAWERGYGRYQIVGGGFTWSQAKFDAETRGAHLVTITSADEQKFVLALPDLQPYRDAVSVLPRELWTGGREEHPSGQGGFTWVTGEQWNYSNFPGTEPASGADTGISLVAYPTHPVWGLNTNGPWNDVGEAEPLPYILEFGYPTDPFSADTDGDGFNDSIETHYKTDPNNASVTPNNSRPTGSVSQWVASEAAQSDVPSALADVVQVAAGGAGYALKADGTVAAWGEIWSGSGSSDWGPGSGNIPAYVPEGLSNVVQVDAGINYALILKGDGSPETWGHFWDGYGHQPAFVPEGLTGVVQISAGISHAAALKADGTIVVWGTNNWGQTNVPEGLSDVVQVEAGGYHTVALKRDGTVVVWGGIRSEVRNVPDGLSDVVEIAAGGHICVAVKSDGTVVAWGWDNLDGLNVPSGLNGVAAISASPHVATIAVKDDGTAVSWGNQSNLPVVSSPILQADAGWGRNIVLSAEPSDSDGDGIPDNFETNTGTWVSSSDTGTDPNNPDTDGDGLLDGVETNTGVYDSPDETGTNPNLADTDSDGLADRVETASYIYIDATDTGTDPNIADSDSDGLSDGAETNTGVFAGPTDTGTNPLEADTSGDGLLDGDVVSAGYNPNISYTALFNLIKTKGVATQEGIGLFSESAMMDLNLGGVTLRKSGGTVNLRLQVQSKLNLSDPQWHNEGTETFILDMPGNKAFMRIRALGPQ